VSRARAALAVVVLAGLASAAGAAEDGITFFERNIRPLFSDKCGKCHDASIGKTKGGLALDTAKGWREGGENGPALIPGKPDESLLLKALSWKDPDLRMPPQKEGGKLPDAQLALVKQWIAMGAPDPRDGNNAKLSGLTAEARAHWAYQPVKDPPVPAVRDQAWAKNEIDAFVLAGLDAAGLKPSPPAAKEVLIRRATYDLTGLPPTVEEVAAFVADTRSDAFAHVVDRLLASPHYGERWGRHWLDSARYSDTRGNMNNGGKYRFEDYRYQAAWTYRDYVIQAINADKPWNTFLVEQLAADQLPGVGANDPRLAALGFITVGKRFQNDDDVIDERIDAVGKSMLGLTVACARCHDHKFDPIPMADYYSLHGVFNNLNEPYELPELNNGDPAKRADYDAKMADYQGRNRVRFYEQVARLLGEFQMNAEGYLLLVTERNQSPERAALAKAYGLPWNPEDQELRDAVRLAPENPVIGPYARVARLPKPAADSKEAQDAWAAKAADALAAALNDKKNRVNPLVAAALAGLKPQNLAEVARAYGALFARAAESTAAHLAALATVGGPAPATDPALAELIGWPYALPAAAEIMTVEQQITYFQKIPFQDKTAAGFYFSLINEVRLTHPGSPGWAMAVRDAPNPKDSYVYLRGDRAKRGAVVPRRFLGILAGPERKPFVNGSGRYELAQAIVDPANPLTARVAVNRAWMHHLGEGFVRTPDDLGAMAGKPSHPELLDWLVSRFVAEGWSMKKLHRRIMLSATWQQASTPDPARAAKDPENRLLWRANLRRLDFEAIRDSLVLLTGRLDEAIGGKPVNITDEPYSYRRSIYGYVDRSALSDLMTQFDFSDPEMPNSRRATTIVPQQALFFMNSPMSADVARQVMAREEVAGAGDDAARVGAIHRILFQRAPQPQEIEMAAAFVAEATKIHPAPKKIAAKPLVAAKPAAPGKAQPTDEMMMMNRNKYAALKNKGETVERSPLTPWQLYVQALICCNEFVYVN
jgi:hypothetical protein